MAPPCFFLTPAKRKPYARTAIDGHRFVRIAVLAVLISSIGLGADAATDLRPDVNPLWPRTHTSVAVYQTMGHRVKTYISTLWAVRCCLPPPNPPLVSFLWGSLACGLPGNATSRRPPTSVSRRITLDGMLSAYGSPFAGAVAVRPPERDISHTGKSAPPEFANGQRAANAGEHQAATTPDPPGRRTKTLPYSGAAIVSL